MADGFALWSPDDRLIIFNEQFRKNCGAAGDVIAPGITFETFVRAFIVRNRRCPPEEVEERVTRRMAQRCTPGGRFEVVGPGGEVYQVLERVTRDNGAVCISVDITEIRRAEAALRESEALHRLLFDAAPQGIIVVQDDTVVLANQTAAQIHGFDSPQQFVGHAPHAFIHPDDLARVRRRAACVVAIGEENHLEDAQFRIVRADGTCCHVMSGATRFTYRGADALLIHQLDVTEQVKAREEKQVLEAQLRRAERMKTVGTLAAGIAHEFNNLLVPIVGLTELAIDSLPEGDTAAAMLGQVLSAAERSRELIKHIHAFGRSDRAGDSARAVLAQDLLGAALDRVRPGLPAEIRLRFYADPLCGPVAIQETQFERILVNLCSNAGDAIGTSAGEISVELRPAHLGNPRAAALQALRQGDYVVLTVRDTGCGMDAATMERIFEPFFTTKQVGSGSGLGLAVIHGIVGAHDGGVTVSSEIGKGSEFRVYLPVVKLQSETPYVAAQAIG
jgi:PAS domain S-box-containing protein